MMLLQIQALIIIKLMQLTDEFSVPNSVFDWGKIEVYTWDVKVEYGNILLSVQGVDETIGPVEVGRRVDAVVGNAYGYISKIVRNDQNVIVRD